jgi:hypothetical protein
LASLKKLARQPLLHVPQAFHNPNRRRQAKKHPFLALGKVLWPVPARLKLKGRANIVVAAGGLRTFCARIAKV